ncbi:MAG: hypothetical protein JWO13_773 [Acidobacteriales bacterium]|nr:hypothetical protein [Terriglobales bacterium]
MERTIIATSADEMELLRPAWESLYATGHYTIFQKYGWNQLAARIFEESERPLVVLVENGFSAAIIPAAINSKNELMLLGEKLFDYRDVLWTGNPEILESAWATLLFHVLKKKPTFQMHALRGTPSLAWSSLDVSTFTDAPCVRAEDNADTFHNRLARNFRRLEALNCKLARHNGDASELLTSIYNLKSAQGESLFRNPKRVEMLVAMARTQHNACEIFTLECGSTLVAALVTFIDGPWRRFYTTYHVADEKWAKHSPGLTLIHEAVQRSLAAGLDCDFMTGDQPYKRRLATSAVPLYRVTASAQKLQDIVSAYIPAIAA